MKKTSFQLILLFILLVFLQIWLFDNIHLFGFATPLLYIYFLIKLPISMNRNVVILLSALLGFIIDIFGGTLGLSMTVLVIVGFLRYYLLKLFAPRDVFDDYFPSFSTFGKFLFMRYAVIITLIHIFLLYMIESFSLFTPVLLLLRIAGSFTLTILLIFAFECVTIDVFKK
ncbi:MAG: rod shape-determining protein MreD [Candidatus Azobacteroides sp.]|nr:rod shape-determining protein MreD [Candidatus Azobacteroides sp.]